MTFPGRESSGLNTLRFRPGAGVQGRENPAGLSQLHHYGDREALHFLPPHERLLRWRRFTPILVREGLRSHPPAVQRDWLVVASGAPCPCADEVLCDPEVTPLVGGRRAVGRRLRPEGRIASHETNHVLCS
jgi:hypothetical protein